MQNVTMTIYCKNTLCTPYLTTQGIWAFTGQHFFLHIQTSQPVLFISLAFFIKVIVLSRNDVLYKAETEKTGLMTERATNSVMAPNEYTQNKVGK